MKPDLETLSLIRKNLRRGDESRIAIQLGVGLNHVSAVVNGRETSQRVLMAALKLATRNKETWNKALSYLRV